MIEKPTKEYLIEQAEMIADSNISSLLFYMMEYREYFNYLEIAEIFSNAFNETTKRIAKELEMEDSLEED